MSFYIDKLIATGSRKTDSVIEFIDGVNIVYGPSNTGKTFIVKCIDYIFGSDKNPFDASFGYTSIKLVVKTPRGSISMTRNFDENIVNVISTDEKIESGTYKSKANQKNFEKTINAVWLTLIGVDDMHLLNSNKAFKKQVLSWRTFLHTFLVTETKIISEISVLLSENKMNNTAVISSLIFLLTGNDFSESETKESREIKEAKKKAVKDYINQELFRYSERNNELLALINETEDVDIAKEVEHIIQEISEYEHAINKAIDGNKAILAKLYKNNDALAECNILLDRYDALATQYESDLKRLNFIVDGQINSGNSLSSHCPFCDGEIIVKKNPNYIEAAKSEYKKIKLQMKDLEKASYELRKEKETLEKETEMLISKKAETEELVESQLKPQLGALKDKLSTYRSVIEYKKEIEFLKVLSKQKSADIMETDNDDSSEIVFMAKDHLDYQIINDLTKIIENLLLKLNYPNLFSVSFDKSDMDIVINGKRKGSNGKGYNAFLNSVVAIAFARYLKDNAVYAPKMIILDSPILSLKETEDKKPEESMHNALFSDIVDNQQGIQTIIIENQIPDIDYKDANIIHFTKNTENGRYGFLVDVVE